MLITTLFFYKQLHFASRARSCLIIILSGETLPGEIFVGRNYSLGEIFVTKRKIRHFRPTKSFAL